VIELKQILAKLRKLNIVMFACMIGLCIMGVMFIYSACSVRENHDLQLQYMKHAVIAIVGLMAYMILACLNYKKLIKWSWVFYLACLVLLVMVPFFGTSVMGARRRIFDIQPAEFAKLAMIMVLAWLYGRHSNLNGFLMFCITGAIVGLPCILILSQPDLGTALVMVPTTFAMMFAGKIAPRYIWSTFLVGIIVAGTILGVICAVEKRDLTKDEKVERIIAITHLKKHQVERLQVFMYPDKDLHGSGYTRRQAEIAVGSGGVHGKGYLKGELYALGYLPPSVSANDFIFAVLAEESGFTGSVMVLLLFSGLLAAGLWTAFRCQFNSGRFFCVGVVTLIFSHMFINIAMTIGLMPITGLPLPFISYGGTFMLTMLLALGLVQSVSIYGREPSTSFD